MEDLNQAVSNLSISDEDDRRIFRLMGSTLVNRILRVKHNDHETTLLKLDSFNLEESVWRRLGQILGQSTKLEELKLWECGINMSVLFDGLKNNRSIKKLNFISVNLQGNEQMNGLAPFLRNNPILKEIVLIGCSIDSGDTLKILSNSLTNRTADTIELLSLDDNHFGDINLDALVSALMKCKELYLSRNGIGQRGCNSFARLLKNRNLEMLELYGNPLDNECAVMLAEALAKNNKIKQLTLGTANKITAFGWTKLLKLIRNTSSMKHVLSSNHTLDHLGIQSNPPYDRRLLIPALGVDSFKLLVASLQLNANPNKNSVIRHKIIWGHAMGDLEIGKSSIPDGAMPGILAWFVDEDSSEINLNLIASRPTDIVRLDSFYRIMKSRPSLFG